MDHGHKRMVNKSSHGMGDLGAEISETGKNGFEKQLPGIP